MACFRFATAMKMNRAEIERAAAVEPFTLLKSAGAVDSRVENGRSDDDGR